MAVNQSPRRWPEQDANERFSEFIEASLNEGPQIVTRQGVEVAVLVPFEEWRRLQSAHPTLKELLLAEMPRAEIPVPPRLRGWPQENGGPMLFGELLEAVNRLSLEEQADFLEVLGPRVAERRRIKLAEEIQESRRELAAGQCRPATPPEILKRIS